jgi:hypothetical protein
VAKIPVSLGWRGSGAAPARVPRCPDAGAGSFRSIDSRWSRPSPSSSLPRPRHALFDNFKFVQPANNMIRRERGDDTIATEDGDLSLSSSASMVVLLNTPTREGTHPCHSILLVSQDAYGPK